MMTHLDEASKVGTEYLRRCNAIPVAPQADAPEWIKGAMQLMTDGAQSMNRTNHLEALERYLVFIMAAAGRVTDNPTAARFACSAADDLVGGYLRYAAARAPLKSPPATIEEQRQQFVKHLVSVYCNMHWYPKYLSDCVPDVVQWLQDLAMSPWPRSGANSTSCAVFPFDPSCGLPSAQILAVPPSMEDADLGDDCAQFRHFFPNCKGSVRTGFEYDPGMLAINRQLHELIGTTQGKSMQRTLAMMGNFAPRPSHDYATAGQFTIISALCVGSPPGSNPRARLLEAFLFAKVRFAPPMVYPEWDSFSMWLLTGRDGERVFNGIDALAAMIVIPAVFPVSHVTEFELWRADELPTWLNYQHGHARRAGKDVAHNEYHGVDLTQYLNHRD